MRTYFIYHQSTQTGPFSIKQLKDKAIHKETLVWRDGFTEWIKAGYLKELKELFISAPPSYQSAPGSPGEKKKILQASRHSEDKKNTLLKILSVAVVISVFILFMTKSNKASSLTVSHAVVESEKPKEEVEIKNETPKFNKENELKNLVTIGSSKKNLLGETVIKGKVKNISQVKGFKDIVIKAEFFASSGTSLGSKKFTRFVKLNAGNYVSFKFKTTTPKATKNVRIEVVDAILLN